MSHAFRFLAANAIAIVVSLVACVSANAGVETLAPLNKAYAVFVISYNDTAAIGGVAGTAFFVSSTHAFTAFHVLQAVSFKPQAGYTHSRVWLVHEGEPAIELAETDVTYDQQNDLTAISVRDEVKTKYVYSTDFGNQATVVETEGFRANSTGPHLVRIDNKIEIADVPNLERIHLSGSILKRTRVELRATDVQLNRTPCVQVSYEPIRGMSGGPLLANGKVIGVNSFGDPKTFKQTWAVAFDPRTSALFSPASVGR